MKKIAKIIAFSILSSLIFVIALFSLNKILSNPMIFSVALPKTQAANLDNNIFRAAISSLKVSSLTFAAILIGWILSVVIAFLTQLLPVLLFNNIIRRISKILAPIPVLLWFLFFIILNSFLSLPSFILSLLIVTSTSMFLFLDIIFSSIKTEHKKMYLSVSRLNGHSHIDLSIKYYMPFYILAIVKKSGQIFTTVFLISFLALQFVDTINFGQSSLVETMESDNMFFFLELLFLSISYVLFALLVKSLKLRFSL